MSILAKTAKPGAQITEGYQATVLTLTDKRSLTGIIKDQSADVIGLQMVDGCLRIRRKDIDRSERSSRSLMPDGLFWALNDVEVRDLLAYLVGAQPDVVSRKR
jgi:putative heme-binding domain-containing protein